jgi:hypothetical protein
MKILAKWIPMNTQQLEPGAATWYIAHGDTCSRRQTEQCHLGQDFDEEGGEKTGHQCLIATAPRTPCAPDFFSKRSNNMEKKIWWHTMMLRPKQHHLLQMLRHTMMDTHMSHQQSKSNWIHEAWLWRTRTGLEHCLKKGQTKALIRTTWTQPPQCWRFQRIGSS